TLTVKDLFQTPGWSADGRTIYFGNWKFAPNPEQSTGLLSLNLESKDIRALYRPPNPGVTGGPSPSLSPDGQWLAALLVVEPGRSSLAVLPESGGEPRILLSRPIFGGASLAWTPDSRRILFSSRVGEHSEGNHSEIFIVDSAGGAPKPIGIGMPGGMPHLRLSPDGRRLAIVRMTV